MMPVKFLRLDVTCPDCGAPVELVAQGGSRWERRVVIRCESCGREPMIVVSLVADTKGGRLGVAS